MASDGLTDLEQAAWAGFLVTHDRLWRALAERLASLNVSMAEYSVLSLLHEAGPAGLRMSILAQRHLMSSGGFTRLADRLQRRGLIERRRSTIDGRGFDVTLTPSGRALIRRARRRHHSDLRELFFSRLDDDHLRNLAEVWERLDPEAGAEDGPGDDAEPAPAGKAASSRA
ncbi:MarR family winged helix-turn-helix transcriptional regulator [Streptomonospora nanhaiensis]|uniref:DNA-binding MarR family transcriptional regulator n=1 Tax=Streptomonospora nanhaiensis TaxID=1323731 RepID=A0A853BK97_9ACTN|nr:MarR family transcriptional regulator [Streptomonospora nanhaiensis]MBV2363323.1 MarR family transcriptional regulator [Streptomonospora nanhaiensis]MBX9391460.1 MarR family transcriptional regulator [Streptomonospora nanhaiensis]NYI95683.1 DNA-binding MarR family transcriptional regulator [Streptomonospora nanhaiensis]